MWLRISLGIVRFPNSGIWMQSSRVSSDTGGASKRVRRFGAARLRIGALGEIRTPDPRNRNPMLYPAELRAHQSFQRLTVHARTPCPVASRHATQTCSHLATDFSIPRTRRCERDPRYKPPQSGPWPE